MAALLVPISMLIIFGVFFGMGVVKHKTYTQFFGWVTKEEQPKRYWIAMILYGACFLGSIALLVVFLFYFK